MYTFIGRTGSRGGGGMNVGGLEKFDPVLSTRAILLIDFAIVFQFEFFCSQNCERRLLSPLL